MSQTRDQQRFTISEVAADWHEAMVPQCIMWPSIARINGQLTTLEHTLANTNVMFTGIYSLSQHTDLHHTVRKIQKLQTLTD